LRNTASRSLAHVAATVATLRIWDWQRLRLHAPAWDNAAALAHARDSSSVMSAPIRNPLGLRRSLMPRSSSSSLTVTRRLGMDNVILHQTQQVAAAGQTYGSFHHDRGVRPACCFFGTGVLEGSQPGFLPVLTSSGSRTPRESAADGDPHPDGVATGCIRRAGPPASACPTTRHR